MFWGKEAQGFLYSGEWGQTCLCVSWATGRAVRSINCGTNGREKIQKQANKQEREGGAPPPHHHTTAPSLPPSVDQGREGGAPIPAQHHSALLPSLLPRSKGGRSPSPAPQYPPSPEQQMAAISSSRGRCDSLAILISRYGAKSRLPAHCSTHHKPGKSSKYGDHVMAAQPPPPRARWRHTVR